MDGASSVDNVIMCNNTRALTFNLGDSHLQMTSMHHSSTRERLSSLLPISGIFISASSKNFILYWSLATQVINEQLR